MEFQGMEEYYFAGLSFDVLGWESIDEEAVYKTQRIAPSINKIEDFIEVLELRFEGDKLVGVTEYVEGRGYPVDDLNNGKILERPEESPIQTRKYLYEAKEGLSHLFGEKSTGFNIPEDEAKYSVNYFGNITSGLIEWLPYPEIELFCPEFLMGILYVDYNDPLKPKYLNPEVIEKVNFPDKDQEFAIKTFVKEPYIVDTKFDEFEGCFGYLGVPLWLQHFQIPRCPITGNVMKFMIEIEGSNLSYGRNLEGKYSYDPAVYFFMEPDSKIIGIVLQTT